ncbi:MAG: LPS export ABC transporter permease LptF [Proteobacteria bacterium]|nr:MAG: LPS export ABC transporter permease LptF [Pseudomonadota bacterium]PIE67058.1 MAG: LPS export ABC transporter permease LptF [Deltaproteobacteria bacterium]
MIQSNHNRGVWLNHPFSIINRYLFQEMVPPFLINLAFFSFIFLMKQILEITDMIVNRNVGLGSVGLLLIYTMPHFLQYVIPMSIMMAVLLTFLRMSGDNEIMALKAGGVSVYRLVLPVMCFSLVGTLITACMTLYGVPAGTQRFKALVVDVATKNLNVSLKARTFNDSFKQIMLYVNRIDPESGDLRQVLIEDSRTQGVNNTVIARRGRLVSDAKKMVFHLHLYDGSINQVDLHKRTSHTIRFQTYDIRLDLKSVMTDPGLLHTSPGEMALPLLRQYIDSAGKGTPRYFKALLHYYKKFSIPAACLTMGLLALPLGLQARNTNRAYGIGLGLFFFLLYYILLSVGSAYGENGHYPPVVGMWLPDVVLGGFGVWLLIRSARERPLAIHRMEALVERVVRWGRKT